MRGGRVRGLGGIRIGSLRRGDIAGAAFDHGKARCVRVDRVGADRGVLELQERGHGAALIGNGGLAGYEGRGGLGGLLFFGVNIGVGHGVFHRFDGIHHGVHDGIELFFRRHLDGARYLCRGLRIGLGATRFRLLVFALLDSTICVCDLICGGVRIFRRCIGGRVGAGRSIAVVDSACGMINMLLSLGVQLVCHRHVLLIVVCHPMIKSRADIPRAAAKFQNVFDGSRR